MPDHVTDPERTALCQSLYEDCVDLYQRTGAEVTYVWPSGRVGPYWARRFMRKIVRDHEARPSGVVESVSEMVIKPAPQGFGIIEDAGRLDLALELLVLDEAKPYHRLFAPDIVQAAAERMSVYQGRQDQTRGRTEPNGASQRPDTKRGTEPQEPSNRRGPDSKASAAPDTTPADDLGCL